MVNHVIWRGKYVVFATPVSQKRRCQPISFILDSLSAQINVPDTKFSRNTMKLLNHNASNLNDPTVSFYFPETSFQTSLIVYELQSGMILPDCPSKNFKHTVFLDHDRLYKHQ